MIKYSVLAFRLLILIGFIFIVFKEKLIYLYPLILLYIYLILLEFGIKEEYIFFNKVKDIFFKKNDSPKEKDKVEILPKDSISKEKKYQDSEVKKEYIPQKKEVIPDTTVIQKTKNIVKKKIPTLQNCPEIELSEVKYLIGMNDNENKFLTKPKTQGTFNACIASNSNGADTTGTISFSKFQYIGDAQEWITWNLNTLTKLYPSFSLKIGNTYKLTGYMTIYGQGYSYNVANKMNERMFEIYSTGVEDAKKAGVLCGRYGSIPVFYSSSETGSFLCPIECLIKPININTNTFGIGKGQDVDSGTWKGYTNKTILWIEKL
jgi:hypothetical protein